MQRAHRRAAVGRGMAVGHAAAGNPGMAVMWGVSMDFHQCLHSLSQYQTVGCVPMHIRRVVCAG